MEFGFDNIQTKLDHIGKQIETLTNGNTSTTPALAPPDQNAIYEESHFTTLKANLSTVKALLQTQEAPATEMATVTLSGLLSGNSNLGLGFMALAGLVLGIVLTRLRLDRRR